MNLEGFLPFPVLKARIKIFDTEGTVRSDPCCCLRGPLNCAVSREIGELTRPQFSTRTDCNCLISYNLV